MNEALSVNNSIEGKKTNEALSVNKRLSVLGQVISSLSEIGQKDGEANNLHTPCQDIKVTHLLRDSLRESLKTLQHAKQERSMKIFALTNDDDKLLSNIEASAIQSENQQLNLQLLELELEIEDLLKYEIKCLNQKIRKLKESFYKKELENRDLKKKLSQTQETQEVEHVEKKLYEDEVLLFHKSLENQNEEKKNYEAKIMKMHKNHKETLLEMQKKIEKDEECTRIINMWNEKNRRKKKILKMKNKLQQKEEECTKVIEMWNKYVNNNLGCT